jgi:hypothetical protein
MAKKRKTKKKEEKPRHRLSSFEDVFFGLLVALSLLFISQCFFGEEKAGTMASVTPQEQKPTKMEKSIGKMVSGFPIKKMTPYIAKKDKRVAAFLVAIAKKESNWGMFSPKKNGRDCYNYWGYRGSQNTTKSGYSCFDSPRQAVNVVGGRIRDLVAENVDTPQEMLLWKCGRHCNANTSRGAAKWVRDVNAYYTKFYD